MNILTKIVTNYLDNQKIDDEILIDEIESLFEYASTHQLLCLLVDFFKKNEENYSENIMKIISKYKYFAYRNMLDCKVKLNITTEIFRVLNQTGLDYVMLKGLTFRELYPNPNVRLMSDFDILVRPENLEAIQNSLEYIGYFVVSEKEHECNIYLKHHSGISIELHHKLFASNVFGDLDILDKNIFENSNSVIYSNTKIRVPSYDNSVVYSILHMAKHFAVTGFGLRQLIDFTLFLEKYNNEISFIYVKSVLSMYNVTKFSSYIVEICNRIFKRNFIIFSEDIDEEIYNYTLEFIDKSGVFGHRNFSGDINSIYLNKLQTSKNGLGNIFLVKFKYVFPNREELKLKYEYVSKSIFLLPLAWIHRGLQTIFSKDKLRKKIFFSTPEMNKIKERYNVLKYYNLEQKK